MISICCYCTILFTLISKSTNTEQNKKCVHHKIRPSIYKLSNGKKNAINSNSDLDLWPNDPKINRVLPLPQDNHVVKLGKDPIYKTKVIMWKRPCCKKNSIYSNGDLQLWPNDPKINKVLPLLQRHHVTKFGKDPIYRTKVIVRKPVWTPARHTQYGRIKSGKIKSEIEFGVSFMISGLLCVNTICLA